MSIVIETMGEIENDLRLENVLGEIELQNNEDLVKVSITEIHSSNKPLCSIPDFIFTLYQEMSGKHLFLLPSRLGL